MKTSIQKACRKILKDELNPDLEVNIITQSEVSSKTKAERSFFPGVKNIIAIASGKGGVGKSTLAVNLAIAFGHAGFSTGLIDADIFGPSVPKMLGLEDEHPLVRKENGKDIILPLERYGIKTLSIGFFIRSSDAAVWRGPMASNAFQQLMGDADWGELDYLFVDLPPGTSDIHLTLVQSVAVTGAVIVSTPQEIALADAIKGINMFKNLTINVPVLGLIENMAWFTPEELPENRYYIFGKEGCKKLASQYQLPFLGQIPLVQGIRESSDTGVPAILGKKIISEYFKSVAENLVTEVARRNAEQKPTQKVNVNYNRK
jgi:ATP-binding protein involved in chromosome partitioning